MAEAFIFDVDGVLVESPQEQAWGESLKELMAGQWRDLVSVTGYAPERYTPDVYRQHLAGRKPSEAAAALLAHFGIDDPQGRRGELLCRREQRKVERLINRGRFRTHDDALRFLVKAKAAGARLAAASCSPHSYALISKLDFFGFCCRARMDYEFITLQTTLLDVLDANVCGWQFPRGKPDPEVFLAAARQLEKDPAQCVVVEDAPNGVQAAKAGGMKCIAVARDHDHDLLRSAGADWVFTSLDEIDPAELMAVLQLASLGGDLLTGR